MIQLRPFRVADLEPAFLLDQVCFPAGIAYSRKELQRFLSAASCFALVAESTHKPALHMAGFLIAGHRTKSRQAHIVTIDVAPDVRRAGIGSVLMDTAEEHYRSLACVTLSLEVAINNQNAQRFYASRGFRITAQLPGYYNGELDAYSMSKVL